MAEHQLDLADADATNQLAARLAGSRPPRAVVYLEGELGAGKSTLARALLRSLGVVGTIRSPTYTLVERYPLPAGGEAWHMDLYRIGDPGELEFLGLDGDDVVLWLVEWPERGVGGLPAADLRVQLTMKGDGRHARLAAGTVAGRTWLDTLSATKGAPANS
ncbi:tRNA (adenosine(37)-N6)-threonylcarbamoyltransferase complex ATPase subunit type 1 TsaE [Lysobacter psychrotolerans]|uniref:tRNA threonylcarbamoyladenosine biosynthesis protein TsaE n=1 Tax=Montanilutibacter psychrotolerans TaxID=1327343 RepID=A0A3M8SW09_9GAMM|nr:tRNA (adenosine(37)-N6)-threonylcarbamoyltransferase complex ATPase subunit type 1 TsaE [Lysobacter psychrotolerans]RNF85479.1 tRNA (adenosine(37)-N6)-threonylcarbamoyltransferase complex ATPase subunit type 1 TsaE [Lysobacter psychrotolerans]